MDELIKLDQGRFTTLLVNPSSGVKGEKKIHCLYCGKILFAMNAMFVSVSNGAMPFGMESEVPITVFRVTRLCGSCDHYYIVYFDTKN